MMDPWTDDPQVQADPALEAFLRDMSAHADSSVDPAARAATLEAMLATAAETTTARTAPHSWGRRIRRILGLTGVKLALAAGVAAATTTGGLAATGSLPAPLQEFAHDVGRQLGIGVPDAPGQQKKFDGDPDTTGRDHAPGQQKKSDADPDTTGRDHAPGQQRGDDVPGPSDDVPGSDDAPGRSGDAPGRQDAPADDQVRRDDDARSDQVEPDRAPPADVAPEDAGQPDQAPEQSGNRGGVPADPGRPPDQNTPAGAANQSTSDPAQQPGRPDGPPEDQQRDAGTGAKGAPGGDNGRR